MNNTRIVRLAVKNKPNFVGPQYKERAGLAKPVDDGSYHNSISQLFRAILSTTGWPHFYNTLLLTHVWIRVHSVPELFSPFFRELLHYEVTHFYYPLFSFMQNCSS